MKLLGKNDNLLIKILLWVNIILVVVYLMAAFVGFVNPDNIGFLPLLSLSYPILCVMLALTIPVWLFIRKRYAIISAFAFIITIPQVFTFSPVHYNRFWKERKPGDFTLMTYNAFGFKGPDEGIKGNPALAEILKYDADFVCLQESAQPSWLKDRGLTDEQDKLRKERYPYFEVEKNSSLGYMSKRPVELVLQEGDGVYFEFAVYRTKVFDKTSYIFNMHLESIGLTPSDKELYLNLVSTKEDKSLKGVRSRLMTKLRNAFRNRAAQAERVRTVIDSIAAKNKDAEIFVCGDFNDTPYSYSYLTIKGNLCDAYSNGSIGPTYTYNKNRFYFKIDHLFYSDENLDLVSTRRGNSRGSDHYPLISIFRKKQ